MTRSEATCRRVRSQLALAAGQDLGEYRSRRVWNHLARCLDCRQRYTEFLEQRTVLTSLDPARSAPPTTEFFGGLQRDILDRVGSAPAAVPSMPRRLWIGGLAAALLVLSALAIHFGVNGSGLRQRGADAPPPLLTDFSIDVAPLSHPQGLGARRMVDLLFEQEMGHDVTAATWVEPRRR